MAATWRGALSFGLLSIPIRLYPAARSQRTYLHQLHKKCRARLRQPLFCPTCNRIENRNEVVKGYEYEKGHYVLIDDEDLKKITPKSGKTMEILAFVQQEQIDPVYLHASYFALPDHDADKAYQVLPRRDCGSDHAPARVHRVPSPAKPWDHRAHHVFSKRDS